MICGVYVLQQLYGAMINIGIYFMTYVLLNKNLFGVFSWAVNIPLIIALVFTPALVAKWKGMYKLNKYSYMIATIGRLLVVVAGYMGSVPLMLLFTAIAALGQGPWQGDMNGEKSRWNDVFLHVIRCKNRRRPWYCYCGLDAGFERFCKW